MASIDEPIAPIDIPFTGESTTDRVTTRAETGYIIFGGQVVASQHVSGNAAVEYISGCTCCQSTTACLQSVCPQCTDGYAPAVFDWFIDGGITSIGGGLYSYPGGIVFANGVKFGGFSSAGGAYSTSSFNATGEDCTWVAVLISTGDIFTGLGYGFYFKLYYDSGWKLYVDYWDSNYGVNPYPGPSGNELVFSLSPFDCCPPQIILDPLNATGGNRGGTTSTLTLVSGSPRSLDDPLTITFGSCGCGHVTVPCCTEKIPRALEVILPGATAPAPASTLAAQLGYVSPDFWSGNGYFFVGDYKFVLSCVAGPTWNMKIYLRGTPDVLKYNQNAASSTCYPIYLSFPQAGFDFDGILGGQTFTIDVHV